MAVWEHLADGGQMVGGGGYSQYVLFLNFSQI